MAHRYMETHPWITFRFDPAHDMTSMRLGEAFSKCQHLSGTPLQPGLADDLANVYLAKGVNATTAIEGNTLSEDEVQGILEGDRQLPASQEYLQQEVENVRDVLQRVHDDAFGGVPFRLTPEWLKLQNRGILKGIACEDHVVPGEFTSKTLLVGSVYRGAPPADVPYLVDRLCDWINALIDGSADQSADVRFVNAFTAAVLGHLYIAWIHPFGDGNGRTARALSARSSPTRGWSHGSRRTCSPTTTTAPDRAITSASMPPHEPTTLEDSSPTRRLGSSTCCESRLPTSSRCSDASLGSTMCTNASSTNHTVMRHTGVEPWFSLSLRDASRRDLPSGGSLQSSQRCTRNGKTRPSRTT